MKKLISLTVMLFLVAAPIVRAFAAAPIPSSEIRLNAPHDASSFQLVPRLRRPKQSVVVAVPSSSPEVPPAASQRGAAPAHEPLASYPPYAARPDHPPA